jgi:hypothetical protein
LKTDSGAHYIGRGTSAELDKFIPSSVAQTSLEKMKKI